MNIKWIVVVNRIQARIFQEHPFVLVETLENELGRERNRFLRKDRPGLSRGKPSCRSSTYSLTGEKDPHEDAAIQFARTLGQHLKRAFQAHRIEELTIVAEPRMMGYLRDSLGKLEEKTKWIGKDLCHLNTHEIGERLGFDMREEAVESHRQKGFKYGGR